MQESKIAVLFPGQGSQFIGMGKEFLESDPEAGTLMDLADSISSAPLRKLCLEGPMEELTKAVYLQPALTAANLICWQALKKAGIRPDYFAGHSLGEYSALCASGVLEVEDTLKLVAERGKLSEREGQRNPGGMQAILGLTLEEVEEILATFPENSKVTIANHNCEKQIVISGYHETLAVVDGIVMGAWWWCSMTSSIRRWGARSSVANRSSIMPPSRTSRSIPGRRTWWPWGC